MARVIKVRRKQTKQGPDFRLALYDDRGRFVLTARVYAMTENVALAMADYLETGRLTGFAQNAIRVSEVNG